jgi:hypothetical protein
MTNPPCISQPEGMKRILTAAVLILAVFASIFFGQL